MYFINFKNTSRQYFKLSTTYIYVRMLKYCIEELGWYNCRSNCRYDKRTIPFKLPIKTCKPIMVISYILKKI